MKIGRFEFKLHERKMSLKEKVENHTKLIDTNFYLLTSVQNENDIRMQKIEKSVELVSEILKRLAGGNK